MEYINKLKRYILRFANRYNKGGNYGKFCI